MHSSDNENLDLKHKLTHELRKLLVIALYLFGLFAVFRLYTELGSPASGAAGAGRSRNES
jgi:hypothetical protein